MAALWGNMAVRLQPSLSGFFFLLSSLRVIESAIISFDLYPRRCDLRDDLEDVDGTQDGAK